MSFCKLSLVLRLCFVDLASCSPEELSDTRVSNEKQSLAIEALVYFFCIVFVQDASGRLPVVKSRAMPRPARVQPPTACA